MSTFRHDDWFSHNVPTWRRLLGHLAGREDLRFLEVGCFEGRSAVWVLENLLTAPSARLTVVDTFRGGMEHADMGLDLADLEERFRANVAPWAEKVDVRVGRSSDVLRALGAEVNFLDFAYVDGSHVAEDVLSDAVLTWPMLRDGGILCLDDYTWTGGYADPRLHPRTAADAFAATRRAGTCEVLHVSNQIFLKRRAT